jgi:hypothetical protein
MKDRTYLGYEMPHPDCDESCMYHCTEAGKHSPSCTKEPAFEMNLEFHEGIPDEEGWYFVKLIPGNVDNKEYDVDYCREKSKSDGGGREWCKWYAHNVSHYAKIE